MTRSGEDSALAAWERFLAGALATARKMVAERPVRNGDDEALVVRNCARLMRQALDWEVEATNPFQPRLASWEVLALTGAPPGPNIDSPYSLCRLDLGSTYLLSGTTDGLMDVNVQVRPDFPPKSYDVLGDLGFDDLRPVDGKWELVMGPEPIDDRPFLRFPETAADLHLFLRLYWVDWSHPTRPVVEIRRIDPAVHRSPGVKAEALCAQLDAAAGYLDMRAAFQHNWFEWFFKNVEAPDAVPGGNTHVRYKGERYRIEQDEALIISFEAPVSRYWSVQLYDGLVYDCMDFFGAITLRNNLQADVDPDGMVRIVVAHGDPGARNWLDAGGVEEASWFYRSIWAETNPPIAVEKLAIQDLPGRLHPMTPPFPAEQRELEMATRQRKIAHHFFW